MKRKTDVAAEEAGWDARVCEAGKSLYGVKDLWTRYMCVQVVGGE